MNTENKSTELNDGELDQVAGGGVVFEIEVKAKGGKPQSYKLGSGHVRKDNPKGLFGDDLGVL
ncbi:MAG: hypothetical protein AAGD23_11550 [Pseudomonadota bacterium]